MSRIECTDWRDVYQTKDTNLAFNTFIQTFLHIYNATFPITVLNKHKRKKKDWITRGIINSIKTKNKLLDYKSYLKTPTSTNRKTYNNFRNKLNHVVRIAKRMYYTDIFNKSKHNMKRTWQNINDILHKGQPQSSYHDEFINKNTKISDPNAIANAFNDLFVNLGPSLASKIPRNTRLKELIPDYRSN